MPRCQNQKEIYKIPAQSAEDFGKNFFFARVCAPSENHYAVVEAEGGKNCARCGRIDLRVLRIVLKAASAPDPIGFHAQPFPTLGIFGILPATPVHPL